MLIPKCPAVTDAIVMAATCVSYEPVSHFKLHSIYISPAGECEATLGQF